MEMCYIMFTRKSLAFLYLNICWAVDAKKCLTAQRFASLRSEPKYYNTGGWCLSRDFYKKNKKIFLPKSVDN